MLHKDDLFLKIQNVLLFETRRSLLGRIFLNLPIFLVVRSRSSLPCPAVSPRRRTRPMGPCSCLAGTLVHLMEHAHPHGGNVADTISNDNHHTTPPPTGEGLPTPPPSVRRTRSGRVYNREAMDAIDRNSQNVYTRVLSNQ